MCVTLLLLCTGCASTDPMTAPEALDYKSRAKTRSDGGVQVSASALSAEEGRDIYGISLDRKGVQAVWVEVENKKVGDDWLIKPGMRAAIVIRPTAQKLF